MAAALLLIVLVPSIGTSVNGSRRWIALGGLGLRFARLDHGKLEHAILLGRSEGDDLYARGDGGRDCALPPR